MNAMIRPPFSSQSALGADFWEQRHHYHVAQSGLGQPAPAFVKRLPLFQPPQSRPVLVLGIGRGRDALRFTAVGFEIVGVDDVKQGNEPI